MNRYLERLVGMVWVESVWHIETLEYYRHETFKVVDIRQTYADLLEVIRLWYRVYGVW